ncbi:MAG: cell wall hydrolase [Pseudomonadota bacterium]
MVLPVKQIGLKTRIFALITGVFVALPASAEEDARSKAVTGILELERRQLIALGANRAKKLAGVNQNLLTRIATMARPQTRAEKKKKAAQQSKVASFKALNAVPFEKGGAEWACLTEALYFEARGESFKGIAAVGEVILNRARSSRFPNTVCGVISQGVGGKRGCQFSYKCDGRAEVYREKAAYNRVAKMASVLLAGRVPKYTNGALFYHTTAVRPRWSRTFRRVARVGVHLFYKPG